MSELIAKFMLLSMSLSGVQSTPDNNLNWVVENDWNLSIEHPSFKASSIKIIENCKLNPDFYISFPTLFYGAQEVFLDGIKIENYGDNTFKTSNIVTGSPEVKCSDVLNGKKIDWKATAYSPSYARFYTWPELKNDRLTNKFFGETQYVGGAFGLILISIFSFFVMYKRENSKLAFSVFGAALFISFYVLGCVSPYFTNQFSMLNINKFSDISLSLGNTLLFYAFYLERQVSQRLIKFQFISMSIGVLINLIGTNGDMVQFGTSLQFLAGILVLVQILIKNITILFTIRNWETYLKSISSILFTIVLVFEIFFFTGSSGGPSFLPIGMALSFLTLVLSVNERITQTYMERDYLRKNLEHEVELKTKELQSKTVQLEGTLSDLKKSQAELVHSARLASLGTLSAGIAHEINNSINYVSGALVPLERRVMKIVPENEKQIFEKLFAAIKEGTKLTVDIVRSLRSYTGMNQAKVKDVDMSEVINSVLTILRNRAKDIQVHIDVSPGLQFLGHQVGVNQILMNIISNSIDAIDQKSGQIWIKSYAQNSDVILEIKDNGCGMPIEVQNRIFDPFFTTKDVGKGTGLGMHIVKNEVERHKGQIKIESEVGKGTKFIITFPQIAISDFNLEAS